MIFYYIKSKTTTFTWTSWNYIFANSILQPFDVEKELNAIPALSLEEFQQKVLNSRQQQAHGHARSNSISPTQQNSVTVSLAPTSIVNTSHLSGGAPGVSISQGSVAIVNNQSSSAAVSYHPQVCFPHNISRWISLYWIMTRNKFMN